MLVLPSAATLAALKHAAAKGRPDKADQRQERGEGQRDTKRPAHFCDYL